MKKFNLIQTRIFLKKKKFINKNKNTIKINRSRQRKYSGLRKRLYLVSFGRNSTRGSQSLKCGMALSHITFETEREHKKKICRFECNTIVVKFKLYKN